MSKDVEATSLQKKPHQLENENYLVYVALKQRPASEAMFKTNKHLLLYSNCYKTKWLNDLQIDFFLLLTSYIASRLFGKKDCNMKFRHHNIHNQTHIHTVLQTFYFKDPIGLHYFDSSVCFTKTCFLLQSTLIISIIHFWYKYLVSPVTKSWQIYDHTSLYLNPQPIAPLLFCTIA